VPLHPDFSFDCLPMSSILRNSLLLFAFLCQLVNAAPATEKQSAEQFLASLHFQKGKINLPDNIATLDLPESFRYLPPADAERLLVDGWGNPPGSKNLGMILPAKDSPLSKEGWGVIITYDKDGYIKDNDADSIKYDELLKDMQEGLQEANAERKKAGYPGMTLLGWAEKPSYDKASHKMIWAKQLQVEGSTENTLNYNIRVLGRHGVLVLNAVAGMNQLGQIKAEMPQVVGFTDFSPGNRYADFNEKTDKVAEYGLAALVAGGVAAKLGFFGKIFAFLLAFKKLALFGLIALGGLVMKLLGRSKQES
jgi:uncharacterized membrane-anchored protein